MKILEKISNRDLIILFRTRGRVRNWWAGEQYGLECLIFQVFASFLSIEKGWPARLEDKELCINQKIEFRRTPAISQEFPFNKALDVSVLEAFQSSDNLIFVNY